MATVSVEFIKAGGKERPFLFGYGALKQMARQKNIETLDEFEALEFMIYLGFRHGALEKGMEIDFEQSDMERWFEADFSVFLSAQKILEASQAIDSMGKMLAPNRSQRRGAKKK